VRAILAACDELDRPASVEPRAEVLRRILADCREVDQMTRDVLDFVRTSSDGFDFRFAPTTVQAVVDRALAAVRERAPRSDVAVELVLLQDCAVVWDAGWIARVVESIVVHALQRAPSGGTVVLEARPHGPDVRVEIRFDSLAGAGDAADGGADRMGRTVWTPVIERHLGEWSQRESDAGTSIVLVLPALSEHLRWVEPSEPAAAEKGA
jgi:K+-sensing histidine kinase KdpD